MKKLLLIAVLMLALVLVAVACTETPDEPGTSADTTTVETPTDAPDEEPTQVPTEEPTDVPTEESTEDLTEEPTEESTEAPTEEPTEVPTEVPTEEPTEAPTEAPEDPNAPIYIMDAEFIAEKANTPDDPFTAMDIAFAATITEDGRTYARIATTGGDPYIALIPLGSDMYLTNYLAISYRNNSLYPGQLYMGSGSGWSGSGDFFKANWTTDNEWDLMIVDLSTTGMTSIVDDIFTYLRLDIFDGKVTEDEWFDLEFVAFFESPEQAVAYYEALHGALTKDYNDNSVDTPMPTPPEDDTPDNPPTQDPDIPTFEPGALIDFDLTWLTGKEFQSTQPALGNSHTGPVFNLVDGYINLGPIDLSYYAKCEITYSTTNDKTAFDANGPHVIGLKSEQSSYGFDTAHNYSGDLAHTEMVFRDGGYSDLRVAVVDLTDVTYSGTVYVSGHNAWLHSIFVTGIKLIPAESTEEPEDPVGPEVAEDIDFDLTQLTGKEFQSSQPALGESHTGPVFNLVDGYINLGSIDLSKYSKCEITYSTTNDKTAFDANGPHVIGLKSEQSSYGFDTAHNYSGDLAHTEMVFNDGGYSDLRVAVVDLTDVTYNGTVYVSGHNVWLHSIFVTDIKLIAAEATDEPVKPEDPEEPEDPVGPETSADIDFDLTKFSDQAGYNPDFSAVNINVPMFNLYNQSICLGELDLSGYVQCIITYTFGPNEAAFNATGPHPIGLKSIADAYGVGTHHNNEGKIACVDMEFRSGGIHGDLMRTAIIDLTGVTYKGTVYVSGHSPEGESIMITGIQLIAAEDTESPVEPAQEIDFDLSQFSDQAGYNPDFSAVNINVPMFNLYNQSIYLGDYDLSKYTKCEITYTFGPNEAAFNATGPHPIGLKSNGDAYGVGTHHNDTGSIACVDMEFRSGGIHGDMMRIATIDLINVTYNGAVYVSGHSPEGESIMITRIKLIP